MRPQLGQGMLPLLWRLMRYITRLLTAVGCIMAGPLAMLASDDVDLDSDWRRATRESTGLAPDPKVTPESVVQVYGAPAFSWRGIFGIHTWVSTKPRGAGGYTTFEVLGWRARHGGNAVVASGRDPDREWYGSAPTLLAELRGEAASHAIPLIERAVADYPYAQRYRIWPGPNSNTFVAHISRAVPALSLDLPPSAVGKDYLGIDRFISVTPSGSGIQFSLWGLLGFLVSAPEGWEINLLGLGFGLDPGDLALRLPGVGKIRLDTGRFARIRGPDVR